MTVETLNELLPRAEAGDVHAQEELAFAYVDQDKDYTNAVKWLEEAEKKGHLSVRGAYTLAISYDDGRGEIAKDPVKAEHYYKIAADSEEDNDYVNKACFWLASGHWAGEIQFGEDDEVAVYYLERLLSRQSPAMKDDAKGNLALLHSFSTGKVFDPEKSRMYIAQVKDSTDEDVQRQIKDAEENLSYYEIAKAAQEVMQAASEGEERTRRERAENGDPMAQFLLYVKAPDEEKGQYEHFLISSAEQGYLPAQVRLLGVKGFREGDEVNAYQLAKKIWDNPEFHSDDMYKGIRATVAFQLGTALYEGTGVEKDEDKAHEYLRFVADSDDDSVLIQRARVTCAIIELNEKSPHYNLGSAAETCERVLYSTDTDHKTWALRILMAIYCDPKSSLKNVDKAIEFSQMASQVDDDELKKLGEETLKVNEARKELLNKAEQNDGDALYTLSDDPFFSDESEQYLLRAANAGSAPAQVKLAVRYMLEENKAESFKWAQKAYNSGARNAFLAWTIGFAYANGEVVSQNPAIALRYIREAADTASGDHDIWIDKARAFLMMELCNANGMFGENAQEAVQYAESVYCDSDSDFRDEALKVLILSYGDIDCPAFDQQKAIMYTKMGLDSSNQEVRTAAQNVRNFYHQIVVREVVNRDSALRNNTTYQPTERERIASAINQQLIHYNGATSGSGSSGSSSGGSGSGKKGGCYIATAVYGSYDCPQVWTLRRYRDYKLSSSMFGRLFIKVYYSVSPWAVKRFGNTAFFQRFWRTHLDRWVQKLNSQGYSSVPYDDKEY